MLARLGGGNGLSVLAEAGLGQLRHPYHPAAARPERCEDDHDLHPDGAERDAKGGEESAGPELRRGNRKVLKP
jgi:hypothetical protein